MARKKKFQARVEVYFIIYIATIVSFFAIEGEVKHFKDNQKKILLEVSKDKIQNLVTIRNATDLHGKDTINLKVQLDGAFSKDSFEGTIHLNPIDAPEELGLKELSYNLNPKNEDPDNKTFMAVIPKSDFDLKAEILYRMSADISVMPDEDLVQLELEKSYSDKIIVHKIMDAMTDVGKISLEKQFQNTLDPAGGAIQAPFNITVDRPKVSIVEGLPWEVRVIIGGIVDEDDLELTAIKGGNLIGNLEAGTPVTVVTGRGRKDGKIILRGTRLSDEETSDIEFLLQVRPPLWQKQPSITEAYVGDPIIFEGALRDIPSSETSIRVGGTAVRGGIMPGTIAQLPDLTEEGTITFQVLVDGRDVKGMTHSIKVVKPPAPKVSINPVGRDGNYLTFEITTYGKNNSIRRFRKKGGIGSNRQLGEAQVLGSRKIYRWEVELEEPFDNLESQEIKFNVDDQNKSATSYRKIFIYNY
ncbi:MAG: hypothetical protein HOD43_10620 [Candidatus Marinimicrobia bacterium]|jgi:hypothetical protein|nr:hypothetical protein [Candidatus Neomarinimicrobiota bacterium]MBT3631083.1 hypothetical protein [Candidatus Neomarinimicrobiota bacterium]MBT3825723.1 hypothetical protein [Candidatus Neomarinimicrobiota bacterium]MBT4130533.1 hypothetical protein [Candidatus Neomarinimicrobiota bacterium]MBT4296246.1 hypothetical protein [Candidatus Neomarinimicrobiota bacterium]